MNGLDVALLALLVVAALLGLATGIIRLALGLVSLIAGAIAATALADRAGAQAARWIHAPELALLVGFVAVFAGVLLAFTLVAWLLRKLLATLGLGFVDRALGALLGLGAVLAAAGLAGFVLHTRRPAAALVRGSLALPWLAGIGRWEVEQVPSAARREAGDLLRTLKSRWVEAAAPAGRPREAGATPAVASPSATPRGKARKKDKGRATPAAAARTPAPAASPVAIPALPAGASAVTPAPGAGEP